MKVLIVFLGLLILFEKGSSRASQLKNARKPRSIPAVDALINKLEEGRWKSDDDCLQATLELLRGVRNNTLWAIWAWDSMQPPVGTLYGVQAHLGNYDQCLQAPWSSKHDETPGLQTQYCIVDVKSEGVEETKELDAFDDAEEYFRTPTQFGRRFNHQLFGACLPAICSASSVARVYRHFHQLSHLPDGEVTVDPRDCQKAGEEVVYSTGYYMFWAVISCLFATAVSSSFLTRAETKRGSLITMIGTSFNMKTNYQSLFTISSNEIKVMNGIRFLTAALIVFVHVGFYRILTPVINGLAMNEIVANSSIGKSFAHLEVVVDTFLAMSGLLLTMGLMMGKQKNLLYVLVKRYIRLIGPFALCTMYLTTAVMYMDRGPLWSRANREETGVCVKHWWRNFLMANTDIETLCHVVTWYVSCDFQLAILGTFLFYLFRWNRKLGVAAFVMVTAAVTLNLGLNVYWKHLDILPFTYKSVVLLRNHTALNYTYFKSHARAGPYLVGMIMGYILATYKPCEHRNVISKERSIIATGMSLAVMTAVLSIDFVFNGRAYDPVEAGVVVATNRVCWAAAVCCIVAACEYGSVPLVSGFLSWPGFVPLSKLSYGLYLLHPFIIQKQMYVARAPAIYEYYTMSINGYGVLVTGCAASFVMYLILEAPLINISNALFTERPKLEQNGVKDTNDVDKSVMPHQNGHVKAKVS